MAEKAIKVELSEEDRKILLAQKKILGDVLKPEKKNKGLGALAAELILSGKKTSITGALGSATKQKATESLQEKTKQLKEKFDPLNIINSMFGGGGFGSVMTAAIGKNMGRNEDDIRKFANLDAAEKVTSPENSVPTQMSSGEDGEKSDTMLTEMLKYVIKISEDIRGLKDSSKNQEDLFKDQLILDEKQLGLEEKQLDAANEAKYEDMFGKKPTLVGEDGKDKKETKEEKGFLASLLGFASALGMLVSGPFKSFAALLSFALSPLRGLAKLVGGPLLRGLGALAAVAVPFAKQIGAKAIAGAKTLGAKVVEKAPTLVAGAKAIGSKAVDIGKNIGAKVAEKAPGIIAGVKTMGGKALEGAKSLGGKAMESVGLKAAATVPGALTPFGEVGAKRAAAAGAETAGKEGVAALIKKSIAKRVPKAVASAVGKSIPFLGAAIGVGFALSRLMDGDVVGAGLEAVSGIGSFATAIPATIALVAKDIYQDVYGIKPESDPLVGERLGIIQSETTAAVKAEFAGKVGEEEKTGGDKKEGATTGETKVPGAPELKDGATKSVPSEYKESEKERNSIAPPNLVDGTAVTKAVDEYIAKGGDTNDFNAPELIKEKLQKKYPNADLHLLDSDMIAMKLEKGKSNKTAPTSADANIAQGKGQELKSGSTGVGANQPAPTSKTTASIAPTPAGEKDLFGGLTKFQYEQVTGKENGKYKMSLVGADGKEITDDAKRIAIYKKGRDAMNATMNKSLTDNPTPQLTPAQPTTGEKMTKQSNENTMAKTEAMTGGNNTNTSIVSAPKVTNATNVTNAPINVRNSENTFVRNQDKISSF